MTTQIFFETLENQFKNKLPFVVYSRPINSIIKCWLQEDDTLYTTNDFSESGFVFAPFDFSNPSILLPQKTPSALNFGNGIPLWSGNASSIKIEIDKLLKELSDLLEDKNFSQANKKTWEILFKAAKKEQIDRLEETDLEKIDCNILIEIVELWSDSNSGFFGFRVQKLIWEEICKGIQPFNKDKAIVEFAQKVEWYKEDKRRPWQLRHEISNHVISIKGYLPVPLYSNNNRIDKKDISLIAAIAQRLGECESEDKQES